MNNILRVVCLEPDGEGYVECPICRDLTSSRSCCWWCDSLGWDKASAWEWGLNVAENVEEMGASESQWENAKRLTVTCPGWLDPDTGMRREGMSAYGASVWVDPDRGGFTGKKPEGAVHTNEVAQLRAKLQEAEAFIAQIVAERTKLWIKVSAHEHVLGKVLGGFSGLLAAVRHAEGFLQGDAPKAPDEVDS